MIIDEKLHVEADSLWSGDALNLFGDVRRREYLDSGTESNTTYDVGAAGKLLVDRLTPITATLTYRHDVEPRTSVTGNFSSKEPIRYNRADAQGELTHEFNRLVLRATARYSDLDYRNAQDTAGNFLQQDYRDHRELRVGGEADYALSPAVAPFVTGSYNRFDYDHAKQIGPIRRDSQGYELAAGIDFDLSHLIRGRLQLGYLHQSWDDASIRNVSGPSIRAKIEYFPTQLLTITALASRNLYDSQIVEAPAYLDTSTAVRADYELLRNLILSAEAGYEDADFRGIDRQDRRVNLNVGGTYLINRRFTFRFQYIHLNQDSKGAQASTDYHDNVGYLGLTVAI